MRACNVEFRYSPNVYGRFPLELRKTCTRAMCNSREIFPSVAHALYPTNTAAATTTTAGITFAGTLIRTHS